MMILPAASADLARRLLAWEANSVESSTSTVSAPLRVYEKLRQRIRFLAGITGFYALASRALILAKSEAPDLAAVQVAPDGSLLGLDKSSVQIDLVGHERGAGETILIARLLGLILLFLGEALTLNLISDLWPDASLDNSISGNGGEA